MPHQTLTDAAASIAKLKANPMKVVASGEGLPIAILDDNTPVFYCIPVQTYTALLELVADGELLELARQRALEDSVKISLDKL